MKTVTDLRSIASAVAYHCFMRTTRTADPTPAGAGSEGGRRRRTAGGPEDDAGVRTALIAAAERQLIASADGDIATRAVCEEAGVTQPVLYRLFGDKRGLLEAVADAGFERYAHRKSELETTPDPVGDLYAGWDDHTSFALENPALYRLMFAPRPNSAAGPYRGILRLLEAALLRCAAVGALSTTPPLAAQLILPANIGLALSLIGQPTLFTDPALSHRTRDAVFATVLIEVRTAKDADPVGAGARQLRAQLALIGTQALEPAETALLDHWLERIETSFVP
jgi:AcrR family transcriptional regulator